MKKTSHLLLLSLFILLSVFLACRKFDNPGISSSNKALAEKFLRLPSGTLPETKRVTETLRQLNNKTGFLSTIAKQQGFAVWDKAVVKKINISNRQGIARTENSEDTIIYIPLVIENENRVNA